MGVVTGFFAGDTLENASLMHHVTQSILPLRPERDVQMVDQINDLSF